MKRQKISYGEPLYKLPLSNDWQLIITNHANKFYNNIKYAKGPSLGTNFTLMCPFVMLAHFNELDKVEIGRAHV